MRLSVKIAGIDQVLGRLNTVERKLRKEITRDAVRDAGRVIRGAEKQAAPVSTDPRLVPGLLALAVDVKVKVYRNGAVAVVGPRTNFVRDKKTRQRKITSFGKSVERRREKWWLKRLAQKQPVNLALARKQQPSYYGHLAGPGRHERFATETARDAAAYARAVMVQTILQGIEEAV